MDNKQPSAWWSRGDVCEVCTIPWCARHSPNKGVVRPTECGPLNTTGLESMKVGPIDVFFLDWHSDIEGRRTEVGEAVRRGKSYDRSPGSRLHADLVASVASMWIGRAVEAAVLRPAAIVAVPPKPERKGISLPAIVAERIAVELGLPVLAPFRWLPGTKQAKGVPKDERQRALDSQLETIGEVPAGTVLLVDDVIQSGATISVVERKLRKAGASKVIAFAPSRARKP